MPWSNLYFNNPLINISFVIYFILYLQIINGQYVEGFYIYSRDTNGKGIYKTLTVLHGGGASACTITGLEKFREYEFFLVPFYKKIDGRPSNSRRTRTLEDGVYI